MIMLTFHQDGQQKCLAAALPASAVSPVGAAAIFNC